MPKSQSAVEFIVLASFMLLVILGFFAVTSSRVLEAKDEGDRKTAEDIAELAYREVEIAKSVNDGYIRVFSIPQTVNGVNYTINITDNRELSVNYLGNEYVRFLPSDVIGNISKGFNQISKIKGIIYISLFEPPQECGDLLDNDLDGKIDLEDAGCANEKDKDETNCGDSICEGGETCVLCNSDCGVCPFPSFIYFRNTGSNVAKLDAYGNVVLKGSFQHNFNPNPGGNDEFIVYSGGEPVAMINLNNGKMFIKGYIYQNQVNLSPSPPDTDFIVKNSNEATIAYIDNSGNLYLKGRLTQNSNP